MNRDSQTIFALSSGIGRAAVAVIRVSGPGASQATALLDGDIPRPRHAALRSIVDPTTNRVIDQALVLWLPGPGTFTGEDILELQVHGGRAVVDAVVHLLAGQPGFRLAEPGEFTQRAFRNNRIDLVEVEGLADLINAQTEEQRRQAMYHMAGDASDVYQAWRKNLIEVLARYEAAIDFVEEEDITEDVVHQCRPDLIRLRDELASTLDNKNRGERLRDGFKVVIAGEPNIGKSSLLNALAARDAAIVSDVPGTTRDSIEVHLDIMGLPVRLVDTAGLRPESQDQIERIGMAKSREWLKKADLVIHLAGPSNADELFEFVDSVPLRVFSKADLYSDESIDGDFDAVISAKTGYGLDNLVDLIGHRLRSTVNLGEPALIVRERHRLAVQEAVELLDRALSDQSSPLEVQAEAIRLAARSLGRLTGYIDVEEVLGQIFSEFCIGK